MINGFYLFLDDESSSLDPTIVVGVVVVVVLPTFQLLGSIAIQVPNLGALFCFLIQGSYSGV